MQRRRMSRREFLDAALRHGAAVGMVGGLLPALACSTGDVPAEASPLDLDETILSSLIDEILPAADGMPSASQAGVIDYFRRVSVPVPELTELLQEVVSAAEGAAGTRFGTTPGELDRDQRIEVLRAIEGSEPDRFGAFRNFVYEAYYVNPDVWALLGYDPYPTNAPGPVMEPFDPALLGRVRALPPLYVQAD